MSEPSPSSRPYNFPIARAVWRFTRKRLRKWLERHQLPLNFWLHMIGIPLAVAGVVLWCYSDWLWGTTAFVIGYVLQYLGHRAEGNDVGEWAAIKRLFGLPCVAVSPRWQKAGEQANAS